MGYRLLATGEEVIFKLKPLEFDPSLNGQRGLVCNLKLNGPFRLALHDSGSFRNLIGLSYITDAQTDQVAGTKFAVYGQFEQC